MTDQITSPPPFSSDQQTIIDCVVAYPGRFKRSSLAKLLAGSRSSRLEVEIAAEYHGVLASFTRKQVTMAIDSLQQQGYLQSDSRQFLFPP